MIEDWLAHFAIGGGAQIFSEDSQANANSTTLVTTAETTLVTSNSLPMPYGNGKVVIQGMAIITPGTNTTSVQMRIRRNPSAENLLIGGTVNIAVTAAVVIAIPWCTVDQVPDGRNVNYALTVQQVAATANGAVQPAFIDTRVISG